MFDEASDQFEKDMPNLVKMMNETNFFSLTKFKSRTPLAEAERLSVQNTFYEEENSLERII